MNKVRKGIEMITTADSLEFLKTFDDFTFDINYSDPPYQLGSEVIIRKDGKVDYKKSVDFMNKWGGLSGDYWNAWFKEAYRTLKHGGYCIMFGIDRQLLLFKYYANLAGFEEQQSLYWYFISNFPKATDLSKMIDKNAGAEREKVRTKPRPETSGTMVNGEDTRPWIEKSRELGYHEHDSNIPSTDLAKKYEGYKYSISPLKQTNETIMVFRKPYKSGSCLHDTLAYENGDNECRCGALNIDGNRVGTEKRTQFSGKGTNGDVYNEYPQNNAHYEEVEGRYPAQTFCNEKTAEVLDKQSGVNKGDGHWSKTKVSGYGEFGGGKSEYFGVGQKDHIVAGCSKILHKCNYEQEDYDIYNYQPKVSKSERNAGCDGEPQQYSHDGRNKEIENPYQRNKSVAINNHPTLKPIKLNERILKLFKTPNDDKIVYPFAGSGSEIVGGIKAGFNNWVGCEINPDYVEIAKARIDYWTTQDNQLTIFELERE